MLGTDAGQRLKRIDIARIKLEHFLEVLCRIRQLRPRFGNVAQQLVTVSGFRRLLHNQPGQNFRLFITFDAECAAPQHSQAINVFRVELNGPGRRLVGAAALVFLQVGQRLEAKRPLQLRIGGDGTRDILERPIRVFKHRECQGDVTKHVGVIRHHRQRSFELGNRLTRPTDIEQDIAAANKFLHVDLKAHDSAGLRSCFPGCIQRDR